MTRTTQRTLPRRRPRPADRPEGAAVHRSPFATDGELHTHHGVLRHTSLIGQPDGSVVANSAGHEYLALRPLLRDFVMSMPRGAAIVYPKDAAQIIAEADVFPGAVVVEAGVGSGALSLWLLRADRAGRAADLVRAPAPSSPTSRARTSRPTSGVCPRTGTSSSAIWSSRCPRRSAPASVDRVVLDMLAPWECIDVVADALTPGGVVLCYVATATQLSRVAEFIRGTGLFTDPEASETMVRGWHVEGLAVRPGSPDDRAHRLPDLGTPARAGRHRARGQAARVEVELRRRGCRAVDSRARSAIVRSPTRTCASGCARRSAPPTERAWPRARRGRRRLPSSAAGAYPDSI